MKSIRITLIAFAVMAATALTACNSEKVTPDRLEEARQTAKANAEFNASLYKAANPRFTADYSIVGRSDTTQTADCPQGDGWASLSIMRVEGKQVDKTSLRCSTYSSSVGCYREDDFVKDKQLVSEDGICRKEVPYPIPTLKK